jgi:hypothetical protein
MSEALSLAHYTQSVCDSVGIITVVVVVVGEIDGAELHKSGVRDLSHHPSLTVL